MDNLKCPQCGKALADGVTVCVACGKEENPAKMSGSKKLYSILAVLLVLFGSGALLVFSGLLPNPLQDRSTVAIVNGEKIFAFEVNKELETYKRNYGKAKGIDFSSTEGKKALDTIRKKIIEIMIQKRILLAAAAEEKITVTPREVTDKINAIKTGLKLSDTGFEEWLRKNDMNMAGYKQRIEQDALFKKVFERGVQKGMERDAWLNELKARAKIEVFE